ncbi:MAG: MBL fold metallo-hydrolase [Candidatus Riflebacteria bacterium]|nr:MBL fold metallo-hydrolase [Candidatus Riflebacteria bacterium]
MKLIFACLAAFSCVCNMAVFSAPVFDTDIIRSDAGDIKLTFLGHGTLFIEFAGNVIHIDPWTKLADYKTLPKADLVLITHEHGDHLDATAVADLRKDSTIILCSEACLKVLPKEKALKNGESMEAFGIKIQALPAYNIIHKRDNGEPFHPKGSGNGYLLTIGNKRILIGGDTENIDELKVLKDIDVAFLPMNLPYTMTPEMVTGLALTMKPKILYPYHFGDTDTGKLIELLKNESAIEVRIRKMN